MRTLLAQRAYPLDHSDEAIEVLVKQTRSCGSGPAASA
jgi:hypothetical protein